MPKKRLYPDLSAELNASGLDHSSSERSEDSEGNETSVKKNRSGLVRSFESLKGNNTTAGSTINRSSSFSSLGGDLTHHDESFEEWWDVTWRNVYAQVDSFCSRLQQHISIPYLFISFLCLIFLLYLFNTSSSVPILNAELYSTLGDNTKQILDKYPQAAPFYKIELQRGFRHIVRRLAGVELEAEGRPVVLLLASTKPHYTEKLSREFVELIERFIPNTTGTITADYGTKRTDFEKNVAGKVKKIKKGKIGVMEMSNIEKLDGTTPLVLHSLADSDTPAFRNMVYIMTVKIEQDPGTVSSECVDVVTRTLLKSWTSPNLGEDQVYPIISRITNLAVCLVFP
ncbi:unnamed protein product [Bursaphelenchus okinawaensis]|uniref:Uncharacterized protein n=1 Tax=Bursaphelenchus okinawaensis TaxID=465554 RepID=A0A811LRH3_9BILA|nr:unnamed protein product [Bursaphelenchus okinawaensis]CAG9127388.1 unnamed protein product [Bursaphelenchus okinawaensis]